jgi:hypothetical protein
MLRVPPNERLTLNHAVMLAPFGSDGSCARRESRQSSYAGQSTCAGSSCCALSGFGEARA